jgi:hypothetical protein
MNNNPAQFSLLSRILHWLMAALLLAMLFIGVAMVSSLGDYHKLVALHRPLGILILILAAIRVVNRMFTTLPAISADHVTPGTADCHGLRKIALHADVCAAPGGVGDAFGGTLSYRDVWARASAGHSSGQPNALCRLAQKPHHPRLSPVRDLPGPPCRRIVPYPGDS